MNAALRGLWPGASGPVVAAVFQRLLALVFLVAWLSLAVQIQVLIGERGLMPLWSFLDGAGAEGLPWGAYPSLLRWQVLATNPALLAGTLVGAAVAALALVGLRPRLFFALSTVLYLSYAAACRDFLSFQWDNLLLECGFLAIFLPASRPAPVAHLLFRLVVFKLYFESGIAKWGSPLHDWHDGSAMTFYYETAPLPAGLAWTAHNLPAWWHHLESRATLVLELVLPFGIFGPRRARLAVAAALTGFQLVNAATGNYGFFCFLAVALHVFLLDDRDLQRIPRWLRLRLRLPAFPPSCVISDPEPTQEGGKAGSRRVVRSLPFVGLGLWSALSLLNAFVHFGGSGAWRATLAPVRRLVEPPRIVNTYHLFASITRHRIEPQFEVETDGQWRALDLRHKPGDPRRRPGLVAPHQPRVDFQLWFHGLSFQRHRPLYVMMLLDRLCHDPAAVAALFRERPPRAPTATRVTYHRYQFTTRAEHRATGDHWRREVVDAGSPVPCDR